MKNLRKIPIGKHRAGETLIVTLDPKRQALVFFDYDYYEEIERKVIQAPLGGREGQRFRVMFIGHATEITVSADGTAFVPRSLIETARVGNISTMETHDRCIVWPTAS